MNELAERKRLLVLEADLHRGIIGMEHQQLRAAVADFWSVPKKVATGKPLLFAGAAAAGFLACRKWPGFRSWLPTALAVLRRL